MSQRLNKYKHHLKFLSSCKQNHCAHLLKSADKELVKCLCECVLNVLRGNVPLNSKQKTDLQKHRQQLRQLIAKGSLAKKKKLLQRGGGVFLPFLLAPIISALGSIFK